jgi:hypothetical protein
MGETHKQKDQATSGIHRPPRGIIFAFSISPLFYPNHCQEMPKSLKHQQSIGRRSCCAKPEESAQTSQDPPPGAADDSRRAA